MNADGNGGAPHGHKTRTLAFDNQGRLYVSIGSAGNVDTNSYRSRIRRFDLTSSSFPLDFATGEIYADGLRNEVGLAFDRFNVLWGVENGADKLIRNDLGGDIHNNNPGEELNRFPEEDIGKHWGYPYCWSEYHLDADDGGLGKGTRWAWPSFMPPASDKDDAWCRANTLPSKLSMQAHSAPLGLTFYQWKENVDSECIGTFPKSMDGHLFVAFHGSWNRSPSTGYKVVTVPFDAEGKVSGDPIDFLVHEGSAPEWSDGMRPVDVDFDSCGRLLMSSDGSRGDGYKGSKIVRMSYEEVSGGGSGSVPSSSGNSGDSGGESGGGSGGGSGGVPSSSGGCCGTPSSGHAKSAGLRSGGEELIDGGWLVMVVVLCMLMMMR